MHKLLQPLFVFGSLLPVKPGTMLSSGTVRFPRAPTANGERYDMHGLTAAHKPYPGTKLEVAIGDAQPYVLMIGVLSLALASLISATEPPKKSDL